MIEIDPDIKFKETKIRFQNVLENLEKLVETTNPSWLSSQHTGLRSKQSKTQKFKWEPSEIRKSYVKIDEVV